MCVYECVGEEILLKFGIQKNSQRRELFGGEGVGLPKSQFPESNNLSSRIP